MVSSSLNFQLCSKKKTQTPFSKGYIFQRVRKEQRAQYLPFTAQFLTVDTMVFKPILELTGVQKITI